ncbi:MAG: FCD domain-containing protein [Coriobacteriales bacterium]|nr:FCD domain-containing protein [Coriobacteriales bacterium]
MAGFEKIDQASLKERFVREIQRKIFAGELLPGEQLPPERELAVQLGVSRSLINVGILDLESRGFVKVEPRCGTFVTDYRKDPTPQTLSALMSYDSTMLDSSLFKSLVDTRRLVERECIRLSIALGDVSAYESMQEALERMRATQDPDDLVVAVFDFHYRLTKASGNLIYPMFFKGFERALHRLMGASLARQTNHEEYFQIHEELLRALQAFDTAAADEAITHIINLATAVLGDSFTQA